MFNTRGVATGLVCFTLGLSVSVWAQSNQDPVDPGPRGGEPGVGGPKTGLNNDEVDFFNDAREKFLEVDSVSGALAGEDGNGLGPTFNGNSCAGCHAEPASGGTSPHPNLGHVRKPNPQIELATLDRVTGGEQRVPRFVTQDGPVREARFVFNPDGTKDGGVHGLYTIAGRVDAPGCNLSQPDFDAELERNNVIFRIPTPVFGLGLVENVPDSALIQNLARTASQRARLGIGGRFNTSGNDGTITRFGWKAQNKSLLIFASEAYNVEQGVSNEGFPNERSAVAGCVFNPTPEDSTNITNPINGGPTGTASQMISDTTNFAAFMRLSEPPESTTHGTSENNGAALFGTRSNPGIGCVLCHTRSLTTGLSPFTGMSNVNFRPFSDFALHHMGAGLADFVNQGAAGPDEFRTAPLWGAGKRIFFLHDGRAGPSNGGLLTAIREHKSLNPNCREGEQFDSSGVACHSDAEGVIDRFEALSTSQKQDILNFLRSL